MKVDEDEAPAVRLAFRLYASGHYSMTNIADMLNQKGYRHRPGPRNKRPSHPGVDPTLFTKEGIRDILGNRFYIGEVTYRRTREKRGKRDRTKSGVVDIHQGKQDAIISRELFELVQEVRKKRKSKPNTYRTPYRIYLINGVVYCSLCGYPLRAQAVASGKRYYREMSHNRNLNCPHARFGAEANVVEGQLGILFTHMELPDDWRAEMESLSDDEIDSRESIEKKRKAIEQRLLQLADDYYMGRMDYLEDKDTFFKKKRLVLQRQLAELPELSSLEDDMMIGGDANSLMSEIWEEAQMGEKRILTQNLIKRIELDVSESRITRIKFYPEFSPLFQQNPLLQPVQEDSFVIRPTTAQEAQSLRIKTWPLLAEMSHSWISWPYLAQWGEKQPLNQRSTPMFGESLRSLRKQGHSGMSALSLRQKQMPPLLLDRRKWPEVRLQSVIVDDDMTDVLSIMPEHSLHVLQTTFPAMQAEAFETLVKEASRALHKRGQWLITFLLIHQMPSHWLHEAFPEYWEKQKSQFIDLWEMNAILNSYGWKLILKKARQTIFQPVLGQTAGMIVEQLTSTHQIDPGQTLAFQDYLTQNDAIELPSLLALAQARIVPL